MAAETPGNHIGLDLQKKSLSLATSNLPLVLMIAALGLLGWFRTQEMSRNLGNLYASQTQMASSLHSVETKLLETIGSLKESLLQSQLTMTQQSSEERAALTTLLQAHSQHSQTQDAEVQQCLDQLPGLIQGLRSRGVGP